jgi:hypothetical protein
MNYFNIKIVFKQFMKHNKYPLKHNSSFTVFEFESFGPKGKIKKVIQFSETMLKSVYNLAFGDEDKISGEFDDFSKSNNHDIYNVLATIVDSIYIFTEANPDYWIYIEGNDLVRKRLYRMVLNINYLDIVRDFEILGFFKGNWQDFQKNKDYEAFLIKRKYFKFGNHEK